MPHDPVERDLRLRRRIRPRPRWPRRRTRCSTGIGRRRRTRSPATLVPEKGWHFLHLFYRVDRSRLAGLT